MKNLFVRFVREDAGQDLIEYGLLVGIITVGCDRGHHRHRGQGRRRSSRLSTRKSARHVDRRTRAGWPALVHLSVDLIGAKVQRTPKERSNADRGTVRKGGRGARDSGRQRTRLD